MGAGGGSGRLVASSGAPADESDDLKAQMQSFQDRLAKIEIRDDLSALVRLPDDP
jgi:hypothetical protein